MNIEKINKLFSDYEKAFSALDFKQNALMFSDAFITAGPKGAIARSRDEFVAHADEVSTFYKKAGQEYAQILGMDTVPISEQYTMVNVHWGVTYQKTGDLVVEFDVSYIVQETDEEPKIIMFVAHQDEDEALKKLELV